MPGSLITSGPMAQRRLLLRCIEPLLLPLTLLAIVASYPPAQGNLDAFLLMAVASIPLAVVTLHTTRAYAAPALSHLHLAIGPVLLACSGVVTCMVVVAYFEKVGHEISRGALMLWAAAAPSVVLLVRGLVIRTHRHALAAGRSGERVVLVGSQTQCVAFAKHLDAHRDLGLHVVGMAGNDLPDDLADPTLRIGRLTELVAVVEGSQAARVIVCSSLGEREAIVATLEQLMASAIPVDLSPDLGDLPVFCMQAGDLGGRPVLGLTGPSFSETSRLAKWLEDRLLGALFLLIATPLMVLIALIIRWVSPGPALFAQERHGAGGRTFRMFKFRSMHHAAGPTTPAPGHRANVADSARVLPRQTTPLPVAVSATTSPLAGDRRPEDFRQATADDPRIFPFGRFLRRSSLDELPQLINVVRGEMSIVGPRPHPIRLNEQFSHDLGDLMRRHFVKPGITGQAQISGARGETRTIEDMRRRVAHDLDYIRNWSLWLDFKIILLTLMKGFFNRQP
jgi:undecaprenyl-phosphate glucose phosphotransferase